MQAFVVPTASEDSTGVLVDDKDLAIHDHVVAILLEELLRANRTVEESDERGVDGVIEVVDAELVLDLVDGSLENTDCLLLLVDLVILIALQGCDDAGEFGVPVIGLVGRAADDERGTCFVDQDRVDLIDDGEVVTALHEFFAAPGHVVAQVVEAELIVRAVGDVSLIRDAALGRGHAREDHADRQAEEAVNAAHPLGVALGEVVVDSDDVNALAGDCVQVGGQGCDEGLAFAGAHLGNVAEMKCGTAHDLDVVMALAQGATRCLAHCGECLGHEVVERLATLVALLVLVGQGTQLFVSQARVLRLQGVDGVLDGLELAQGLALARAEDLVEHAHGVEPFQVAYPAK